MAITGRLELGAIRFGLKFDGRLGPLQKRGSLLSQKKMPAIGCGELGIGGKLRLSCGFRLDSGKAHTTGQSENYTKYYNFNKW
jgi:hypothetical protein